MTPQEFIAKWGAPNGRPGPAYHLNEEQGAQSHFLDLCDLLQVPKPGSTDGYLFEEKSHIIGGRTGYADVFMRGVFAWENKAPGKNLDSALKQLLTYSLALSNPPILVVSDRLTIRIHTQFTGHPSQTHEVRLEELDQPDKLALLRRIWTAPESFKPKVTNRDITEAAAKSFATLAEQLRTRQKAPDGTGGNDAEAVAHFLTQCLFCFFAEDVGLLPGRMFERLVNNRSISPDKLTTGLAGLFTVMRDGGLYGPDDIPWFNGGLFKNIGVPKLEVLDVTELRNAANLNWSAIDVSIFGTLFERGLDPAKRSQLGAHYTDPATIMRLVDPVLRRPLLQKWELLAQEIQGLMAKSAKRNDKHHKAAQARFITWLEQLKDYRVLDPACGSGNFLFLGLKTLKDIEHHSHLQAAELGLDRQADLVTGPHNVLGIELNEYAAELARVTVWIGELQWRIEHGYAFKTNPVLEPLDHIECRDALLTQDPVRAEPVEATWPTASVVIGNPPFLGGSKKRGELGDAYFEALNHVYADRVPGGADLVCYWFDKARMQMQSGNLEAAGLVATQAIRSGSNRVVLTALQEPITIFNAWADEPWINEGAAVRVSLICFGIEKHTAELDGQLVPRINADLSGIDGLDLTRAQPLEQNLASAFKGAEKSGKFDISGDKARMWLTQPNPNGRSNAEVLLPWRNGSDITDRAKDQWVIDYGVDISVSDAALYELPFKHVVAEVQSERAKNNDRGRRENWWRFGRNGADMRAGIDGLTRIIATVRVSKHRFFVWLNTPISPDSRLQVIARADDVTFGILSSRLHEAWSLAQASMHGVGNDPTYNAKSCFETFPFPDGLTPADTAHQRTEPIDGGALIPAGTSTSSVRTAAEGIAIAAKKLNDLRETWLNPPEWTERVPEVVPLGMTHSPYPDRIIAKPGFEKELAKRTLTNLYNQRPAWLSAAHEALDAAVAAAYGWADYTPATPDEDILKRLLALNLARATPHDNSATKRTPKP